MEIILRSKHIKLDLKCSLQHKLKEIIFDILNLKILFSSSINMNIFFNFVKNLNKDYMFRVGLSRFMGIQAKFIIYFITLK
jgi:hypothetical protein